MSKRNGTKLCRTWNKAFLRNTQIIRGPILARLSQRDFLHQYRHVGLEYMSRERETPSDKVLLTLLKVTQVPYDDFYQVCDFVGSHLAADYSLSVEVVPKADTQMCTRPYNNEPDWQTK